MVYTNPLTNLVQPNELISTRTGRPLHAQSSIISTDDSQALPDSQYLRQTPNDENVQVDSRKKRSFSNDLDQGKSLCPQNLCQLLIMKSPQGTFFDHSLFDTRRIETHDCPWNAIVYSNMILISARSPSQTERAPSSLAGKASAGFTFSTHRKYSM